MNKEKTAEICDKIGKGTAVGLKATVFGLCWTVKKTVEGSKAVGREFSEQWKKVK